MNLDRRSFLIGTGAAFSVAGAARADETTVVIIGAGAAGIGAARELQKRGISYIMVEARQRAGGRLHTDRSLGPFFDAGGEFIHFSTRNPWTDLAREAGIDANGSEPLWQGSRAYRNGQPFSDEELQARRLASRRASEVFEDIDSSNDLSFADALKNEPDIVRRSGRSQSRMATGEEDRYVSVADWQQLASGSNLTVPGGYGALAEKIAAALPVRYGVRVTGIDWSGAGVRVMTDKGDIRARYAIVTVSVGVLQKSSIPFTPALPAATVRALSGLRMGALTKIALHFQGNRLGFNPYQFLIEAGDPDRSMSFECWPQNQDVVVAVTGGDYARELTRAGEAVAVQAALDTFAAIAGNDARAAFKTGRLAGWAADPFAEGSYSVLLPGRSGAREMLARPVANRLWFAGEASAGTYAMTAGGATYAGQNAAAEIAAAESRKKS